MQYIVNDNKYMNQEIHFPSKFSVGTDPGINSNFTILIIKNMYPKHNEA